MAGRTWVHVSTLMQWNRPPVGIVRVEQEYCRWLAAQSPAVTGERRYCRFDRASGCFVEVPAEQVSQRLLALTSGMWAPDEVALPPPSAIKVLLRRLLPDLLWRPLQASRRLAAQIGRRLRQIGMAAGRRLPGSDRLPAEAPFATGDRFVSLGLDWDTLDQTVLYRLKRQHRLDVTLMCYDVIPALFPHLVVLPPGNFAAYIADAAWCADRFVCISERTRRDLRALLTHLGAPVPRCEVVRLGSDVAHGVAARPPAGPVGEDGRPFVLFVSTIERRKNHEVLYRAWLRLRERGLVPHRLVFVGMPGWGVTDLMNDLRLDPRVQDDIVMLSRVDDAELAWLYRNCAFTVFPSLYEGWGLPVAESLAWGKFCLASNVASLPEVGGDLIEYLDPWDLPQWVERLAHYMTQPQAVAAHEARIVERHVPSRWVDTAAAIHRIATDA